MKKILAIAAVLLVAVSSAANAAKIELKPLVAASNVYSVYVDGEASNGAFDTIFFKAVPTSGTFINTNSGALSGVPRAAGDAFTYPNRMLNADPLDFPGALGLTQVGLVNTAQELSFTVGALGGTVSTGAQADGDLFLGNLNLSGASGVASAQVQLISAGNVIFDQTITIPAPEPASFALAGLGLVGLVAARRRKA